MPVRQETREKVTACLGNPLLTVTHYQMPEWPMEWPMRRLVLFEELIGIFWRFSKMNTTMGIATE